jgi:hypothetical protein
MVRGLNHNHNHDLKDLFKGAATTASSRDGVFREFYLRLLQKGMQPEMARLTLARKIAAITAEDLEERRDVQLRAFDTTSSLSAQTPRGEAAV